MNHKIATITLKPGKEKQPANHHPWVFSGAIGFPKKQDIDKNGHLVKVESSKGEFVAYGWCDINSHIMIRLLSWDVAILPDESWWIDRVTDAVLRRKEMVSTNRNITNAYRLIHGESDFLPGVAVDLYKDIVVVLLSARVALHYELTIVSVLEKLLSPAFIHVSFDSSFIHLEHSTELAHIYKEGKRVNDLLEFPKISTFSENTYLYILDVLGQKSGFYCDQRENRALVANYTQGKKVLDAFCYTGAFTMNALGAKAETVTCVDSSLSALTSLKKNIALNIHKELIPLDSQERVKIVKANVFDYLREMEENVFDVIILDPPKLASTKGQVPNALKAYKDLNRLAISKVKRGGIIATFSCSAGVTSSDLQTAIAWAAKDAKREVHIRSFLSQSPDHPIRVSFPESHYLTGFLLFVI
ncbi:MAG: class I SAM-dependent rRNA methyltransferase [Spirochaetia bacterium]|nr:class I SAM-dependent rRNA methyltransferase [Spirochaetia bacterium]